MKSIFMATLLTISASLTFAQNIPSGCVGGNLKTKDYMLCNGDSVFMIYDNTGRRAVRAHLLNIVSPTEGIVRLGDHSIPVVPVLDVAMTRGCLKIINEKKAQPQVCIGNLVIPTKTTSSQTAYQVVGLIEDGGIVVQNPEFTNADSIYHDNAVVLNADEFEFAN